jgi:ribosome-binding factor A
MSSSNSPRRARRGRGPSTPSFTAAPDEASSDLLHPLPHVRQLRLEQALREHLASLLRNALHDPHLEGLWLVALELSDDGRLARASVALEPRLHPPAGREARVLPALARATGFLRAELAQGLDLKRLPALRFTLLGVLSSAQPEDALEGGDA